jgi:hypothetical protein
MQAKEITDLDTENINLITLTYEEERDTILDSWSRMMKKHTSSSALRALITNEYIRISNEHNCNIDDK